MIQVHDWLTLGVSGGINQSQARIIKDVLNSEKLYIIHLLHIIDIQNVWPANCYSLWNH